MLERTRAASPFYTAEHEAFREVVRRFVAREIAPHVDAWDEAGEFPRELYAKAAEIGLIGLGFPAEYGGMECDRFMRIMATQEFARCGSGGLAAGLFSHTIGAPPIVAARLGRVEGARVAAGTFGCEDLRARDHRA